MYTEQVISTVKTFLSNHLEAELVIIEAALTKTVTRLTTFDCVMPNSPTYPLAVVYDSGDEFVEDELADDQEISTIVIEVGDYRNALSQLRTNLYAYRDAFLKIIKDDTTLGGSFLQVFSVGVEPPLVLRENADYRGAIKITLKLYR